MGLRRWSRSEVEYGRRVLNSGLEGARSGGAAYLKGVPFAGFVGESIRTGLSPAAAGAYIGVLGCCAGNRRNSIGRMLAFGLLGGALGLGASVAWKSRRLTASAVSEASRNVKRVRGEHWMKKNFIAYG